MTKESIYELQKIDCNCNDCKHLTRLFNKQNNILAEDKILDEEIFYLVKDRKAKDIQDGIDNLIKNKHLINDYERKLDKYKNKLKVLLATKYGYQGQKTPIQYGVCQKLDKEVTFIPNTLQPETQNCFEHRRS